MHRVGESRATGNVTLSRANQVAKNCACGLSTTGTRSVKHKLSGRFGFNKNRVECSANCSERMCPWNQRRINANRHSLDTSFRGVDAFCNCKQLDDVAISLSCAHQVWSHICDSLAIDLLDWHLGVKSKVGQDCSLLRCVISFDVKSRICLEIAELGCFGHRGF